MISEEYEDSEESRTDKVINFLLEKGAIELVGVDKTGDFVYCLTPKCKEIFPELFEEHFSHVNEIAFQLWQKGLIEIRFEEEGPLVMLKNVEETKKILDTVDPEERVFLENMLRNHDMENNGWYN
ncbi:MAG: hypothetical protein ACO295_05130 [Sediminibacterium sp.]